MPGAIGAGVSMSDPNRRLTVGEIVGVFGVRGWLKIRSFTDPPENIFDYFPWQIGDHGAWSECEVAEGRRHGRGLIARLPGIEDRDGAAALVGNTLAVYRHQLPPVGDDIYWTDLEGLEVVTTAGRALGKVDHLIETGANDVLVVRGERERLIPFVRDQVIKRIDLEARCITVDWDAEF